MSFLNGPPESRIVIAIDINCFYAQVEILKRPELRNQPVGVFQKHLVVTTNYVARKIGASKMVPIRVAKKACPPIILIDGSDLAPYRAANSTWVRAVREWGRRQRGGKGMKLQKQGLDEVFLDVSTIVSSRIKDKKYSIGFRGHLCGTETDDVFRQRLMVGSQVAEEVRSHIEQSTGLQSCGGIGTSKLCAKLAVDTHKPNDQTTLFQSSAMLHIASLPARDIPGFGHGYHGKLTAFDTENELKTAGDILARFETRVKELGDIMENQAAANKFLDACRGIDVSEVKESVAPVVITSEDSFRSSNTLEDVYRRVRFQVIEMLERLQADVIEHHRRCKTLTVRFRHRFRTLEEGYGYVNRAVPMPLEVQGDSLRSGSPEKFDRAVTAVMSMAMKVLEEHAGVSEGRAFDLSLVGVGAKNFTEILDVDKTHGIGKFLTSQKGVDETNIESRNQDRERVSVISKQPIRKPISGSVCPVCSHQFSPNTSNGELNRHVDLCLTGTSSDSRNLLSLSVKRSLHKPKNKRRGLERYFVRSAKRRA